MRRKNITSENSNGTQNFRELSVLINPRTGKLLAMLMRQWDYDTGFEIQLCDLKCGQQVLF